MKQLAYFDYAAATPMDPRVLESMRPYLTESFANPSSMHSAGRRQKAALEAARHKIASILGAKTPEIIFTSGSTESSYIAINGVAKAFPGSGLIATAIEHESILTQLKSLQRDGHQTEFLRPDSKGYIRPDHVAEAVKDTTVLMVVQYVNHEIGTIQSISKIAQQLKAIRQKRHKRGVKMPIYLYCDAAQAGLMPLGVSRLGVDMMSLSGTKLYGPGAGLLYVRTGVQLAPILVGGGQEAGLRSGTESVAYAVGLAEALGLVQLGRENEQARQMELRDYLWAELSQLDGVSLNGSLKNRAPGNLNISLEGCDGESLVAYLDKEGYAVATGSACTAARQDPSNTLTSIGLSRSQAESSLRITLGKPTTKLQAEGLVAALKKVIPRLRHLSSGH